MSDNNATCTEDGTKTATCDVCGVAKDTIKDTGSAETKGHTWDDGVITKAATADSEGEKLFTCKDCQATKTESIPKLEQNPAAPSEDNTTPVVNTPTPTPEPATDTPTPTPEAVSTQSPKTGDDSALMLWNVLLMLSGIGLVGTGIIRKKNN